MFLYMTVSCSNQILTINCYWQIYIIEGMMDINNKTIWITGASSGIGKALAIACAEQGARLILSARNVEKLIALKSSLVNSEQHSVVPIDLADAQELSNNLPSIVSQHKTIDVLVNNGGISQRGNARDTALFVQREVMEVNYFGTIAMTQAVLPSMLSAGGGMIVTVSSVAGKVGGKSMSGYSASKHAVIGYMDSLRAEESQHGIHVLTVCPGFVQTDISVNAMMADGQAFGKVANAIKSGISAQACAAKIIKAIRLKKNEVVIGKGISYWAPTIYRFFPQTFRKISASKNFRS